MFSLAYVILPFSDVPPAEAIAASLARFQRGRRGDVPDDWLRFHDETSHVQEVYRARITFTRGQGLRTEGADTFYLDTRAVLDDMERRGVSSWSIRFAEIEPDITAFVSRYMPRLERHPAKGGYGQWLNGLSRWDWWDLDGRFDGVITENEAVGGRPRSSINSGPSVGRAALGRVEAALGEALGHDAPAVVDVETDRNIEQVSHLLANAKNAADHRWPER